MNESIDGITVRVLGDFGPFSVIGKSIGYEINIGRSEFLMDCGTPVFQQIGTEGLQAMKGLFVTHCHDDHKRWFTDIALFRLYEADYRIPLFTSEEIYDELCRASGPALDRSLDRESKKIVDIAYENYIDYRIIGPRARYRICSVDEGEGRSVLCIKDTDGNLIGPDQAKIVISSKTKRPRMLFKDPEYGEWIEPESFYSFNSDVFYEKDKNPYNDPEGYTVEAVKAPVWHGIANIGFRITTGNESLVFSSDTVHDKDLWEQLCKEKREQKLGMSRDEFESASVIYGDINDYTERTWNEQRFRDAANAFKDAAVIHDIAGPNSIVHTGYNRLENTFLNRDMTMLTHSPDTITSEWVLCGINKTYKVVKTMFYEKVGDTLYPMNADIYHRKGEKCFVGYKNKNGKYLLYKENGMLNLTENTESKNISPLYTIDLYEDISGKYFPYLEGNDQTYVKRHDGKIELIEFTQEGSRGKIIEDLRGKLTKNTASTSKEQTPA